MRKITIRIDDITEDMDWDKMNRFESMLDRYGICPLIGVIPCNKDESLMTGQKKADYAAWLKEKQKQGWVIAMHGHDHVYTTKKGGLFPLNHFSEFAGLPFEDQLHKLREGCKAIKALDIRTDVFMAPAHSFDKNTVKALKMCGFQYITDGFGDGPYKRDKIIYLPIAVQRSKELHKSAGITTFVVHTATMKEEDFLSYEKLFASHRGQFVHYSEMMKMDVVPQTWMQRIWEYGLAVMKEIVCRLKK